MPTPLRPSSSARNYPGASEQRQRHASGRSRQPTQLGGKTLAGGSGKSRQTVNNRQPRTRPPLANSERSGTGQRTQLLSSGSNQLSARLGLKTSAQASGKSRQVVTRRNRHNRRSRRPVAPRFRATTVATETISLYVCQETYRRMSYLATANNLPLATWMRRTVEHSLDQMEADRGLAPLDVDAAPITNQVDRYPMEDSPPDRKIDLRVTLSTKLRLQRLAVHERRPLSAWLRHELDKCLPAFERPGQRRS